MRWLDYLRSDTTIYEDFLAWLRDRELQALRALADARGEDIPRAQGAHAELARIVQIATQVEREETAYAKTFGKARVSDGRAQGGRPGGR